MKYWDYENYDGSLEETINSLNARCVTINSITILKYAEGKNEAGQKVMFPVRALILYS